MSFQSAPACAGVSVVIAGAPAQSARVRLLRDVFLILMFSTLVVDGFPAGGAILREFGSRITNFLLLVPLIGLLIKRRLSSDSFAFTRAGLLLLVIASIGIPALNLPVTALQSSALSNHAYIDWVLQFAMLLWGLTSYWLWRELLRDVSIQHLAALITIGAILPLVCFIGDLFGSQPLEAILSLVRIKRDPRPSGLATEPSLYAAWLAFAWPWVLFQCTRAEFYATRLATCLIFAGLVITAYLSNARTIAAIVVLQLAFYAIYVTASRRGISRYRALLVLTFCTVAVFAAFAQSLASLTNVDLGSNIGRIGSTVTAARVAWGHPLAGVGIGQLKYFFGAYAPDFALVSEEILSYANGAAEFRASSFNLFVRLVMEFGFPLGLLFGWVILRPLFQSVRQGMTNPFVAYPVVAAIGGVGFWLSQDQYGYQPAILSLAILANVSPGAGPARNVVPVVIDAASKT